jgi:hypothetical protein
MATTTATRMKTIEEYLGSKVEHLVTFSTPKISRERLHSPRPDMGGAAVGAAIYFGSEESSREIVEVRQAFALWHKMGMAAVLWCYVRNKVFKKDKDSDVSADLTGQANRLGVTIQADIIKQKPPENNSGNGTHGKYDERMYVAYAHEWGIDKPEIRDWKWPCT